MRLHHITTSALATVLIFACANTAQAEQPLLPATANDQVPGALRQLSAPVTPIERKPLAFVWALDPTLALSSPTAATSTSREYWQTVDAATLGKGVQLPTQSAGALIRISPAAGAAPLQTDALSVSNGRRPIAIARLADASSLQQAGMPVSNGTQVLRLGEGSGPGYALLRAANARGHYVVHVFEPNSDVLLRAQANRTSILAGQPMHVAIDAQRAGLATVVQAQALLVAPDGRSSPVAVLHRQGGGLEAVFTPAAGNRRDLGLWELQVFAMVGDTPRDTRTAFAVGQTTAKFAGSVQATGTLRVTLPVLVASPGRYEARGTLYATGPDKQLRPVAEAHAAAWMEPGRHALALPFARQQLPSGYGAPFELRQLELNDQSRMAPLEHRAYAARF